MSKIFNHRDVLLRPVISEKSYGLQDEFNKYTFIVAPHANKTQIRQAVEALPEKQLAAVILHKYQDVDYRQIASI